MPLKGAGSFKRKNSQNNSRGKKQNCEGELKLEQ